MTYEPLHHKYRPQKFADLVGQEAVATTLSNAIALQRIAPAYLFSGPRGTGKTSSARILAKSLNCLNSETPTADPCGVCDVCQTIARGTSLDVIEIDAASNTGVDNIRELIERSQFAPVQCRFKIYCLDEVHMLSTAAFNALLKTLEEPPDRVVFILATTDPQRVLPTIISRCQRFDFRRIPLHALIQHLGYIAKTEEIQITAEALELIAQLSQGGLRDAESLLDQLSLLADQIQIEDVWNLAGSVPEQDLLTLVKAIAARNAEQLLDSARKLMDLGREPLIVLQGLTSFYRDLLIAKTAPSRRDLVAITEKTWAELQEFVQSLSTDQLLIGQQHLRECEVQVKNTTQPRLWLEITLLGLMTPQGTQAAIPAVMPTAIQQVPIAPPIVQPAPQVHPSTSAPASSPAPAPTQAPANASTQAPLAEQNSEVIHPYPQEVEPAPQPTAPRSTQPTQAHATQPAPSAPAPAVPAVPEPAAPPVSAGSLDLQQAWQGLQQHLSPLTSALLVEHGHLAKLKSTSAVIGISTKPLAKIAQSRLDDIEKAFAEFLHKKIKVSIEVINRGDTAPPTSAQATIANTTVSEPPTPFPAQPQGQPPVVPPPSYPSAPSQSPPPQASMAQTAAPVRSAPMPPATAPGPNAWDTEITDPATYAATSFAQFFNGALVDLPEEGAPESADQNGASQNGTPPTK